MYRLLQLMFEKVPKNVPQKCMLFYIIVYTFVVHY